ncbi:MAG: GTP-binding protein [Alcaligenaceae bacterium]|nr:MAG: GTP-binding protein [Alcaligenaceae bacterium]
MTPLILLTGFLGSGKTTLLAGLLRRPTFARTAVIINEFGAVGLDHELLEAGDDNIIELTNGCLCCRVQTDLAKTLAQLDRRRALGEVAFERVIIETSGLADPVPIVHALTSDLSIGGTFELEHVVTVVDELCAVQTAEQYPEARRQIALADVLVLSKQDLASPEDHAHTSAYLDRLNQTALRVASRELEQALLQATSAVPVAAAGTYQRLGLKASDHAGHTHGSPTQRTAEQVYTTLEVIRDKPLAANVIPLFLEALATHEGASLLRLKGLVQIAEMPGQPLVLHGVQHVFYQPVWLERWPSQDHRTRIVLIGHGLSKVWVQRLLEALEAEVATLTIG